MKITNYDLNEDEYVPRGMLNKQFQQGKYNSWVEIDRGYQIPSYNTRERLEAGVYCFRIYREQVCLKQENLFTDELYEFKDSIAELICKEYKMFASKQKQYADLKLSHRRGIFLYGSQGCHAPGTKIIMYNGSTKLVEDIVVGDLLMGPDGKSREVLKLVSGQDEMFKITPTKGESFIVNSEHILHLHGSGRVSVPSVINVSVKSFLKTSKPFRERFLLKRSEELPFSEKDLKIPPYILGVWLGDGTTGKPEVTNIDEEIIQEWSNYAQSLGLQITKNNIQHSATNGCGGKTNPIINLLRYYNVFINKHIPYDYLTASVNQRLELLAGLLDSDGYYHHNDYNFVNKNESIIDGVIYLARSLGFAAYKSKTKKGVWYKKHYKEGIYYRCCISGNLENIPCRVQRKKPRKRQQIKNVLRTGFKVESIGSGKYYGFTLDNDHLYLTSDFTIHHNCGKSSVVHRIIHHAVQNGGIAVQMDVNPELFTTGLRMIRGVEPDRPIVCFMEDIDALIEKFGEASLLSLLDGESQVDGVFNIATSNYPEKLDRRLVNRPRRFDRVIRVEKPSQDLRRQYIEKKLELTDTVDANKVEVLLEASEGLSFSALTELIISTEIMEIPLEEAKKIIRKVEKNKHSSNEEKQKMGFNDG